MQYNTQQKKLIMPEYGRNIQNMVDYCVSIKNRDERTRCAYTIVDVMGNKFPHLRDVDDFKHILWDHLAIMSDFKLDIDYPYQVVTKEGINTPPERLQYSRPTMKYRHYGKIIENMIHKAAEMDQGEERTQLVKLLLKQMKRSYIQWNKDVEDEKIFADMKELSDGKIVIENGSYVIPESKDLMRKEKKSNANCRKNGKSE